MNNADNFRPRPAEKGPSNSPNDSTHLSVAGKTLGHSRMVAGSTKDDDDFFQFEGYLGCPMG